MLDNINISIVGIGLMGMQHIKAIEQCKNIKLHSIIDPRSSSKEVADNKKVKWFENIDELLMQDKIPDGVIIATPNQLHKEHTLKILNNKIPVLLEKPIADSIYAAETIVSESIKRETDLLIGYHRRHNPITKFVKKQIDSGKLGKIVSVHGNFWLYKPDDYFDEEWRRNKGAGPLGINCVHDIDLLCYLLGDIKSVQALKSNKIRKFEVEDTAVVLLEFNSGALGTLNISDTIVSPWSYELTAGENPAYPETSESSYFIGGTESSLQFPNARRWYHLNEKSWWSPISSEQIPIEKDHPLVNQIKHFANVINKIEKPIVSGQDGLKSLKIFEAINESVSKNSKIII